MEETLRKILQKYQNFPKQVYHYTDANAFLSILSNKKLWASHILFQNDKKEALYSLDLLYEVLKEKEQIFKNNYFDINEIFNDIKSFTGQNTFTISFSEKRDDLNQWRGYANTPISYCIGFAPKELKEIQIKNEDFTDETVDTENTRNKRKEPIVESITNTLFYSCIYEREPQKRLIEAIIDKQFYYKEYKKDELNNFGMAVQIMTDFLPVSSLYKHPSFSEEKEYRLVFENVPRKKIQIRMGHDRFIPYIEVPIDTKNIKDIVIGPCDNEQYIYNQTSYVCQTYDIEFLRSTGRKLENSQVPFRR